MSDSNFETQIVTQTDSSAAVIFPGQVSREPVSTYHVHVTRIDVSQIAFIVMRDAISATRARLTDFIENPSEDKLDELTVVGESYLEQCPFVSLEQYVAIFRDYLTRENSVF